MHNMNNSTNSSTATSSSQLQRVERGGYSASQACASRTLSLRHVARTLCEQGYDQTSDRSTEGSNGQVNTIELSNFPNLYTPTPHYQCFPSALGPSYPSNIDPILGRIIDRNSFALPNTTARRLAPSSVDPKHLLQPLTTHNPRLLGQLQPTHRTFTFTIDTSHSTRWRITGRKLLERTNAIAMARGVEIEKRRRGVEEVVVAREIHVYGRRRRRRDRQVQRDGRDAGQQGRVHGGDARDVVEGCGCAVGDGRGGRVCGVAGVVLGSAADGDVAQCQVVGGWGEGDGCYVEG